MQPIHDAQHAGQRSDYVAEDELLNSPCSVLILLTSHVDGEVYYDVARQHGLLAHQYQRLSITASNGVTESCSSHVAHGARQRRHHRRVTYHRITVSVLPSGVSTTA